MDDGAVRHHCGPTCSQSTITTFKLHGSLHPASMMLWRYYDPKSEATQPLLTAQLQAPASLLAETPRTTTIISASPIQLQTPLQSSCGSKVTRKYIRDAAMGVAAATIGTATVASKCPQEIPVARANQHDNPPTSSTIIKESSSKLSTFPITRSSHHYKHQASCQDFRLYG